MAQGKSELTYSTTARPAERTSARNADRVHNPGARVLTDLDLVNAKWRADHFFTLKTHEQIRRVFTEMGGFRLGAGQQGFVERTRAIRRPQKS